MYDYRQMVKRSELADPFQAHSGIKKRNGSVNLILKTSNQSLTSSDRPPDSSSDSSTEHKPQSPHNLLPPTKWILCSFFFLLATLFGYRRVLATFLLLPVYSIGFLIMLIVFNLALSYWSQYEDLRQSSINSESGFSVNSKKKLLYNRLSFSTPAAYSAALTKIRWENQAEWRKQPLHPSLKSKTAAGLDRLIAKIMRDFVWKASRSP